MALQLQPIDFDEACEFVRLHHRHHLPPVGHKFSIGASWYLDMDDLLSALQSAWCAETAAGEWSADVPSLNQCAVTALIVQDHMGGELLRCPMTGGGSHYWNQLPGGAELDLTQAQFEHIDSQPIRDQCEERERSYVLSYPATVARYELLKSKIPGPHVVGVAIVGRPVARMLDNGWTLEVTRCCTDGTRNVPSMLYGAAKRAAFALGYRRLITYTLDTEPGTSLTAANWRCIGAAGGGSWSCPSRPRVDKHPLQGKLLWEAA